MSSVYPTNNCADIDEKIRTSVPTMLYVESHDYSFLGMLVPPPMARALVRVHVEYQVCARQTVHHIPFNF